MNRRNLVYILCLLAFVELSSRVFWRMLDHTWGFVVPQQIGCFDPELGWGLEPGARAWSKATGAKVEYAINARGARGPEYTPEKPAGVFRIVVVGDSHTFGFGIPQEQTFTNVLKGYFKDVEVINLGVSGYGVDQMLLRLTRDGFPLKPDLVVCYVPHFGDFRHMTDKIWGMGKPRLVEQDGKLALQNSPVANNSPLLMAGIAVDRFLSEWCRTYEILRNTVYSLMLPKAKPGEAPALDPTVWKAAVDHGFRLVRTMEAQCRLSGVDFVLATRVGELSVEAILAGMHVEYWGNFLYNDALVLAHDPQRHPNEAANGMIALELARHLKKNNLVPEGYWRLPL